LTLTDSKGTHGFQVHFDRQGNIYTQFFSDANYGGKENARKEARYFRDQLKEKIPKSITGSPAWTGKARSNTGKMGVSFTKEGGLKSEVQHRTGLIMKGLVRSVRTA
jgi:hypothetical protein